MSVKGNQGVGRVCGDDSHVICKEGEVRKRWRDCFTMLLKSDDQSLQQGYHREILIEP